MHQRFNAISNLIVWQVRRSPQNQNSVGILVPASGKIHLTSSISISIKFHDHFISSPKDGFLYATECIMGGPFTATSQSVFDMVEVRVSGLTITLVQT